MFRASWNYLLLHIFFFKDKSYIHSSVWPNYIVTIKVIQKNYQNTDRKNACIIYLGSEQFNFHLNSSWIPFLNENVAREVCSTFRPNWHKNKHPVNYWKEYMYWMCSPTPTWPRISQLQPTETVWHCDLLSLPHRHHEISSGAHIVEDGEVKAHLCGLVWGI